MASEQVPAPAVVTAEEILDALRARILRALQSGALREGDRLPSARQAAREFGVDYRVVLAAYRALADEELVDLRSRGGIYVRPPRSSGGGLPPLPERWIVEELTQALARQIPAPELHEWMRRSIETLRLHAVVISTTADQVQGLCRELRDDFGLDATAVLAEELPESAAPVPAAIRRADLLIATAAHATRVQQLAIAARKPVIVISLRPDLTVGEWALLLRRPVYAVVATNEFGEMLRRFFAEVPGVENLRVLVFGRDDLSTIPDGEPTYVTQRVREQLAGVALRGRILPAARTISVESAREIFTFIVRHNLEALSRLASASTGS